MIGRLSPAKAVDRGTLTVNGSAMLVMFGFPAVCWGLAVLFGRDDQSAGGLAALGFLAAMPLAWLTWSLLVPRWRVWAYERVENLDELKARGIRAGLIWPDGHFLEKTEIRTSSQRKRIQEIETSWVESRKG